MRVQFMTLGLILAEPHLVAGKLRALAVLDPKRHAHLPGVPSVAELGYPDLVMQTWFGIVVPKGTPPAVIARVNAEIGKALESRDVIACLAFLADDVARWKQVVRDAAIAVD